MLKMMTSVYITKAWTWVSKMSRVIQKSKEIDVKSTYSLQGNWLTIVSKFLTVTKIQHLS